MIKAVIFDYGGVVENSHNKKCVEEIASSYGVSEEIVLKTMGPLRDSFCKGKISEYLYWKKFSLALQKPFPKNYKDLWRNSYARDFYIFPEIKKLVKELKKRNIKTAVLSNVTKPHVKITRKMNGYKGFDVVVLSCEVGLKKPERKIYLLTAKKLGLKPNECVFIDDRRENLLPAKQLGMKTILARNPKQVTKAVSKIVNL